MAAGPVAAQAAGPLVISAGLLDIPGGCRIPWRADSTDRGSWRLCPGYRPEIALIRGAFLHQSGHETGADLPIIRFGAGSGQGRKGQECRRQQNFGVNWRQGGGMASLWRFFRWVVGWVMADGDRIRQGDGSDGSELRCRKAPVKEPQRQKARGGAKCPKVKGMSPENPGTVSSLRWPGCRQVAPSYCSRIRQRCT